MSQPVHEYDVSIACAVAKLNRPLTPREEALLDRFFQIYEGDSMKAGRALAKYVTTGDSR